MNAGAARRGTHARRRQAGVVEAAAQQRTCRAGGRRRSRSDTRPPIWGAPRRSARRSGRLRFVTPPVEVITTTITTWAGAAAPRRGATVVAWSGGADTSASSRVTCESISVVAWSADSTSVRASVQVERERRRLRLQPVEQLVGVVAVAALGRHAARRRCAGASAGRAARARRARGARSRARRGACALDEGLRADRLAGGDELLDDAAEDLRWRWVSGRSITLKC